MSERKTSENKFLPDSEREKERERERERAAMRRFGGDDDIRVEKLQLTNLRSATPNDQLPLLAVAI